MADNCVYHAANRHLLLFPGTDGSNRSGSLIRGLFNDFI
jgi:hypothetical protein